MGGARAASGDGVSLGGRRSRISGVLVAVAAGRDMRRRELSGRRRAGRDSRPCGERIRVDRNRLRRRPDMSRRCLGLDTRIRTARRSSRPRAPPVADLRRPRVPLRPVEFPSLRLPGESALSPPAPSDGSGHRPQAGGGRSCPEPGRREVPASVAPSPHERIRVVTTTPPWWRSSHRGVARPVGVDGRVPNGTFASSVDARDTRPRGRARRIDAYPCAATRPIPRPRLFAACGSSNPPHYPYAGGREAPFVARGS